MTTTKGAGPAVWAAMTLAMAAFAPAMAQEAAESPLSAAFPKESRACRDGAGLTATATAAPEAVQGCTTLLGSSLAEPVERAQILLLRGLIRLRQGDTDAARPDLDEALKMAGEPAVLAADPTLRADVRVVRAALFQRLGQPADVNLEFDRAIKDAPERLATYLARALWRGTTGDYRGKLADIEHLLTVEKANPYLLNSACWTRAAELNVQLFTAQEQCDAAIRLAPDNPAYRDSRGMVFLRLGRHQDAFDDYSAALRVQPDNASSLYGRGLAAGKLGLAERSAADLARARELSKTVEADYARRGFKP